MELLESKLLSCIAYYKEDYALPIVTELHQVKELIQQVYSTHLCNLKLFMFSNVGIDDESELINNFINSNSLRYTKYSLIAYTNKDVSGVLFSVYIPDDYNLYPSLYIAKGDKIKLDDNHFIFDLAINGYNILKNSLRKPITCKSLSDAIAIELSDYIHKTIIDLKLRS